MSIDLAGAADLHCHFGPDPHLQRSVDALEAAQQAAAAGHAAVVLKSHSYPTSALATIVERVVDGIRVFGGICCDRDVGGLNPAAVETALLTAAKIVWLPTLSSKQDYDSGVGPQLGLPAPGISIFDEHGEISAATHEIAALCLEHGAILATGHVSWAEHLAVSGEFAARQPILVTHAMEELAGPNLSVEQCGELAALGAHIELCALTCQGFLATRPPAEIADCIRAVGVEHVTLGSDYGQAKNEPPAAGLQSFAEALYAEGISEADLRTMTCTNPCTLLGVDT